MGSKSVPKCCNHAADVCREFSIRWDSLRSVKVSYGDIDISLRPQAFADLAGKLNLKRHRFDVYQEGNYLRVSSETRGVTWSTAVFRESDPEQWKVMHDALRLEDKQQRLPAPQPKRLTHRQLCLPAPEGVTS